ncbi:hypothetical protein G8764_02635 [Pseudomaricurvus alcaniphilus]|uniref:hypothetical protein n=1 Tax=Pseudomaricurvus alcaniphilus TaxID=1166482 RepID=UPI001408F655|nr:hypothetical protein [Pseudomaricurvus alcaniphilus]NHN36185.1 hypothetical protein [Pseudomaricurvus alcaniphilus]
MAIYEEQFAEHPVHEALSQLQAALRQKHKHKLDDTALDNLDRLNQSASFIEQRLLQASPVLNSAGKLGNVQKGIAASLGEINQFLSNGNSGHLTNASNSVEASVVAAATLVSISGALPSTGAAEATSFKKLADAAIKQINSEAEAAQAKQALFDEQVKLFTQQTSELKTQLDALSVNSAAKLEEIEARFEAEKAERETEFSNLTDESSGKFDSQLSKTREDTEKLITSIKEKKSEAERIVQLVGNVGLTGNYKGAGDNEKKSADTLRNIALGCFVGTSIFVAIVLYLSASGEFDILKSFFRLTAALVLLIPGTYAAKESAKHRTLESRHRRAELELASINAYLDDLPDEERNKLKASLTDRFFGQPVVEEGKQPDVAPSSLISLLKQSIDALSKK